MNHYVVHLKHTVVIQLYLNFLKKITTLLKKKKKKLHSYPLGKYYSGPDLSEEKTGPRKTGNLSFQIQLLQPQRTGLTHPTNTGPGPSGNWVDLGESPGSLVKNDFYSKAAFASCYSPSHQHSE